MDLRCAYDLQALGRLALAREHSAVPSNELIAGGCVR